jgi:hypothetical protein
LAINQFADVESSFTAQMTGTARELRHETLPAELERDAILEINISSGKLKTPKCGRVSSGGAS